MHANLVLFKKDGTQKIFPLSSEVTIIGRRHDCDLRIPLLPVSRRHCQLSKNDNTLKIRDLGSRSGTFINGKRIDETAVNAGDYIRVGPLTFLLQIDGKPEEILPPKKAATKPAQTTPKSAPQQKAPAPESSDSFADLDLSDSFLTELEEL
jgi:pSer/pThr/pTyr-binding forkhead associated (FHA) protein